VALSLIFHRSLLSWMQFHGSCFDEARHGQVRLFSIPLLNSWLADLSQILLLHADNVNCKSSFAWTQLQAVFVYCYKYILNKRNRDSLWLFDIPSLWIVFMQISCISFLDEARYGQVRLFWMPLLKVSQTDLKSNIAVTCWQCNVPNISFAWSLWQAVFMCVIITNWTKHWRVDIYCTLWLQLLRYFTFMVSWLPLHDIIPKAIFQSCSMDMLNITNSFPLWPILIDPFWTQPLSFFEEERQRLFDSKLLFYMPCCVMWIFRANATTLILSISSPLVVC